MQFLTLCRLPEDPAAQEKLKLAPTQLIRSAIEREEGRVMVLGGTNAGWDCCCIFEAQSAEAQVRITSVLKRVGFHTETRTFIDAAELDAAWANAVQHPVAIGR